MKNATIVLELFVLLILSSSLIFFFGCASSPELKGTEGELWAGKLAGMIDADLKMYFSRFDEKEDHYEVKGSFNGEIGRVAGGYGSGTMRGTLSGEVKEGNVVVRIRGTATVNEGSASITGKLRGTLLDNQAAGTWDIDARSSEGSHYFSGQWHADKTDSAIQ
ncbi:MAG: hypothetical protein KQI78_03660 [Deltaproteobacteria bacterium]|nr:hypothetical protein [Deltaproteobacteria bacterium]